MADDLTGKKTYFGLTIVKNNGGFGVCESDIRKLPFYEFWKEKSLGSTCGVFYDENGKMIEDDSFIHIYDWEKFCRIFINTGS